MSVKGSRKTVTRNPETGRFQGRKHFSRQLSDLRDKGLYRKLACIDSSLHSKISINGRTLINFSSNDYLNLSRHPEIIKTAVTALEEFGFGSGASRLLSGNYTAHERLEKRVAEFKRTQASLIFNTGYAANTGIIPAIAADDAVIFSDELNHASIVDGSRLSRAEVMIYNHNDMDCLEALLKKTAGKKSIKRKLIITETVFSMDGDIAPLKELAEISDRYDALLMIDDAHGTGVLGKTGRGGLEHHGLKPGSIIQMGTLSKALGCFGAFAAGEKNMVDLLINKARSFIYSTSLPPAVAEAAVRAVEIAGSPSAGLRKKLWRNRQRLYKGISKLGFKTPGSETPIIPVLTGDTGETLELSKYLYKNSIFAPAIRPPTVPEGKCRIRFSVTAGHTDEDIDVLLGVLKKAKGI